MMKMRNLNTLGKRYARDERGTSAIEFGLTAPLFSVLIVGITTIGFQIDDGHQAREAIRSGLHAAMAGETDLTTIKSIVQEALDSNSTRSTVTVTDELRCDNIVVVETLCSSSVYADEFIVINLKTYDDSTRSGTAKVDETQEIRIS